jgi:hypothetical protein
VAGHARETVLDVPAAKEMADHCFAIFSRARDCLEVSKLRTEKMLTAKRRRADPMMEGDMYGIAFYEKFEVEVCSCQIATKIRGAL